MTNYTELGVKIGLEIHQQLNTKKLFCNCPSEIRDDEPDIVITRKLRASAGETGKTDIAAEYETKKERHFIYQAYNKYTCLVELDDEPIHELNKEALKIVLQVSKLLKAKQVDVAQVMRKTVVDGSNTSGFQRTALIARDGILEAGNEKISVQTVCIEEESAKIVSATPQYVTYNLTRLGIPLIEIATGPDIKTPEQAFEAASHIGMILRSTGKVKRGLGTIRQDLNVSIAKGARVEIKGAQELKMLQHLAEMEIARQENLAEVAQQLRDKKAEVSEKIIDITEILQKSSSEMIKKSLDKKDSILAIKLKGFSGLLKKEIKPGQRLGKELSAHARTYAGVGGSIHSDELPKYGITDGDIKRIKDALACHEDDAFIFVAAEKETGKKAMHAIIQRAKQAIEGLPEEVRKANPDGTTTFLRPMPGSARMYPETDTTLIKPEKEGIEMPELITAKAKRYESMGLSKDVASHMSKSDLAEQFEEFSAKYKKVHSSAIAEAMLDNPKEVKKRYNLEVEPTTEQFNAIFDSLEHGKIAKDSVLMILVELGKGAKINEAIGKYILLTEKEMEEIVKQIVSENKGIPQKAIIGKVMEKLRGKADGKKIVEAVNKFAH